MSKVNGSIAILGSGETSPNLVSVHRKLINNLEDKINEQNIELNIYLEQIKELKDRSHHGG